MPAHFLPAKVELTAAEREDVRPFFFTSSFRGPKNISAALVIFLSLAVFDRVSR